MTLSDARPMYLARFLVKIAYHPTQRHNTHVVRNCRHCLNVSCKFDHVNRLNQPFILSSVWLKYGSQTGSQCKNCVFYLKKIPNSMFTIRKIILGSIGR